MRTRRGRACATLKGESADLGAGDTRVLKAAGRLAPARFWDDRDPYLYDVYSVLTVDGRAADVCKVRTGFRTTAFRGGAGTGGVYLNDRFVYLKGYAQRSANEWAGLGQAYPDWMHDLTAELVRGSHANYVRWMHVTPMRADVAACDRYGVVEICPAGDKEADIDVEVVDAEGRRCPTDEGRVDFAVEGRPSGAAGTTAARSARPTPLTWTPSAAPTGWPSARR